MGSIVLGAAVVGRGVVVLTVGLAEELVVAEVGWTQE